MTRLTAFVLTAVLWSFAACGDTGPDFATDQAVEYEMVSIDDLSFLGRKRVSAVIVAPTALTLEQRAQTALKAAVDLQKRTSADAVNVFLEISPGLAGLGFLLAKAQYAPDFRGWTGDRAYRNGSWEASATDEAIPETAIKIVELWGQHESKFQTIDDGFGGTMTDEPALNEYIAEIMDIDPEDVTRAFFDLMKTIPTRRNYVPAERGGG